jgi:NADPH:quinone reductase-like Zn-dependent oxidoreductase
MRALNVQAAGEQPQVSDLPIPEITDGHVLIKVKAAGLNGLDSALASGMMAAMMPHEYPLVLGRDAAGVVEAVGAGVDDVTVGDEVFGHVLFAPPFKAGTLAEYALLPAATVSPKPAQLDDVTAAALPLAGAAAVASVEAIDPQPGQTVLVTGASGGVGSFALQLLAARGATVLATGTGDDAARLTELGAASVIDYTATPVAEQVLAAHPDGVDALIDLVSRTADSLPLTAVRKGGKIASTLGAASEETLAAAGLTGSNIMASPVRDVTVPLAEQAAAGTLKVDVTTVLPLDQAADGLATIACAQARGKIVIKISD